MRYSKPNPVFGDQYKYMPLANVRRMLRWEKSINLSATGNKLLCIYVVAGGKFNHCIKETIKISLSAFGLYRTSFVINFIWNTIFLSEKS